MNKASILLVEDEPFLAKVICDSLEKTGYSVHYAADGTLAQKLFNESPVDLCIVDVMLPGTDGFSLVKQMRASGATTPVLFLTARTAITDVVEGYKSGGNDYLKKPFSLEELLLRINELLRRTGQLGNTEEMAIGKYRLVPHKQLLIMEGEKEIRLSHKETELLRLLSENRNQLLERKPVLLTLWGDDSFFHTRTMDVFITKLRKHLKKDPSVEIINVRGLGYKLIC